MRYKLKGDVAHPVKVDIFQCHYDIAVKEAKKAKKRGATKDELGRICAVAKAVTDPNGLAYKDCNMLRNAIHLQDQNGDWWRADAGPSAKLIASLFDKDNPGLRLPNAGVRLVFGVPKGVRALPHTRSEEFKKQRKASAERRKHGIKRVYTRTDSISLEDIRNGKKGQWV